MRKKWGVCKVASKTGMEWAALFLNRAAKGPRRNQINICPDFQTFYDIYMLFAPYVDPKFFCESPAQSANFFRSFFGAENADNRLRPGRRLGPPDLTFRKLHW